MDELFKLEIENYLNYRENLEYNEYINNEVYLEALDLYREILPELEDITSEIYSVYDITSEESIEDSLDHVIFSYFSTLDELITLNYVENHAYEDQKDILIEDLLKTFDIEDIIYLISINFKELYDTGERKTFTDTGIGFVLQARRYVK